MIDEDKVTQVDILGIIYKGVASVNGKTGVIVLNAHDLGATTEQDVINLISQHGIKFIVVDTLPTENIDLSAIYMIPSPGPSSENYKDEYIYSNGRWELIGTTRLSLDDYYNKQEVDGFVNDIETDAKKIKLEKGPNGTLIFHDYGDKNQLIVPGGYLPDDKTITLEEFNETKRLVAVGLKTTDGVLSGETIKQLISAKGGYLDSANLGIDNQLTQELLVTYAISQIGDNVYFYVGNLSQEQFDGYKYIYTRQERVVNNEVTYYFTPVKVNGTVLTPYDESEDYYILNIWNNTRVINTNNKSAPHTWQWDINSESWSDLGHIEVIVDADNDGLHGLVTGSNDAYKVSINANGTMSVNALPELAQQVNQNETKLNQLVVNERSLSQEKVYSAEYINDHFAPLSFLSKLYFSKLTNSTVKLVDEAPEVSVNNLLNIESANDEFNWNSPIITATRRLPETTTLSSENSFTVTLNFIPHQNCNISFGAKVKVSTDEGNTFTYISSNQSYSQETFVANHLSSTRFTVFTDLLTDDVTYNVNTLFVVEIFMKGINNDYLAIDYSCGYTFDNSNVYSYVQFNYLNILVNTSQIQDGAITYDKLSNELKSKIDKIGDATLLTDSDTLSGAVNELFGKIQDMPNMLVDDLGFVTKSYLNSNLFYINPADVTDMFDE